MRRIVAFLIFALLTVPSNAFPEKNEYQVVGKVLRHDGKPFPRVFSEVYLHGAVTPFRSQTLSGPDGRFHFKKIPPGTYTLVVAVHHAGELSKTIEVGPSFADSKGRVTADLVFAESRPVERDRTVSTAELSVPERARQEFIKARQCLAQRDIKGAVERLKKAVEMAPQFTTAWNELGTISYQTRQFQQAETYFREALKQDPVSYPPLVNLGGTLLSLNKLEEALPFNLAAVKAKPSDALAHSQLGQNYFFLGQAEHAETHLKQAKALDPSHFSHPQIILIEIYIRTKRLSAAVAEMEEFIKLHPDSDWTPKVRKLLETIRADLSAQP